MDDWLKQLKREGTLKAMLDRPKQEDNLRTVIVLLEGVLHERVERTARRTRYYARNEMIRLAGLEDDALADLFRACDDMARLSKLELDLRKRERRRMRRAAKPAGKPKGGQP